MSSSPTRPVSAAPPPPASRRPASKWLVPVAGAEGASDLYPLWASLKKAGIAHDVSGSKGYYIYVSLDRLAQARSVLSSVPNAQEFLLTDADIDYAMQNNGATKGEWIPLVSPQQNASPSQSTDAVPSGPQGSVPPSAPARESDSAYCVLVTRDWEIGSGALTILLTNEMFAYGDTGMFYQLMVRDSDFERARFILLRYPGLEPYVRKARVEDGR